MYHTTHYHTKTVCTLSLYVCTTDNNNDSEKSERYFLLQMIFHNYRKAHVSLCKYIL